MADAIKIGTILIREGTLLLAGVPVESDVFLPGWRLVKNLEREGLDQKFHEAGCTFLSVAGEIGATVFGLDEQKTLRRAVEQILAKRGSAEFNSVEIMRVAWETSKRFLEVRSVTISAQSRDIQEGAALSRAKDLPVKERATIGCRLNQSMGLARGNDELRQGEMIALVKVEMILSL